MAHLSAHDVPPWQGLKDTVLKSPADPLSTDHWPARMWASVFPPRQTSPWNCSVHALHLLSPQEKSSGKKRLRRVDTTNTLPCLLHFNIDWMRKYLLEYSSCFIAETETEGLFPSPTFPNRWSEMQANLNCTRSRIFNHQDALIDILPS